MSCGEKCACTDGADVETIKESWQQNEETAKAQEAQEQARPEGCCGGGCCNHEKRTPTEQS